MKLTLITPEDLPQIREWIQVDLWHRNDPDIYAEGFLSTEGLLSFCVVDDKGPLVFVRLEADGEMVRIVMQFGPESEVSKRRLIVGLIQVGIPAMKKFAESRGYKGLVFESVNPSLIAFGYKMGFVKAERDKDYILTFEGQINV